MRKKQVMPSMMNRKRGTFECASWSTRSNQDEECLGGTRNGRGNSLPREDPSGGSPCRAHAGTVWRGKKGPAGSAHGIPHQGSYLDTRIEAPLAALRCGGNSGLL